MKFYRYCLMGMLVFLCLFGSCSMGGAKPEDFPETEETSKKEEEVASEKETPSEAENPDETQDETQDNPGEIPPLPEFLSCTAVSETEIDFEFSQPVILESLVFNPELEREVIIEEGSVIKVNLAEEPLPGMLVEADLLVKDEYGNSVSEQLTFRTKNNRVPALQINELRTEYSRPKAEFIEFKMFSDGNLGGLRVFVVGNDKSPLLYEFEPVEVKTGDYVVLHLRTLEEALCVDEYGENLNESSGTDSSPTARDFWIPGSNKLLHKTDAVYVLDQDDEVLDAVMIAESSSPSWGNTNFADAAEFLFSKGAWKSPAEKVCSPADAVNSSASTLTRSISRKEMAENTHTAADWYIAKTSGVSPGKPNNP